MYFRWLGFSLNTIGAMVVFFASLFAVLERDSITGGLAGLSVSYAQQVTYNLDYHGYGILRKLGINKDLTFALFLLSYDPFQNKINENIKKTWHKTEEKCKKYFI